MKLTFIADTHHYSKTLGITGKKYEYRSGSDQKCLGETSEILDSAFEYLANSDTDYVLIAGDVTNDGERASHIEFKEKLDKLAKHKKIYLITATHDWCCDKNPRKFDGDTVSNDVEVMAPEELYPFYEEYTIKNAISKFKTHLGTYSYVVQLDEKTRLIALNDDQNGRGRAGFNDEHFAWIDEQLKKAKQDGCLMIGMEHHLLIPHINPVITGGGTCVGDREDVIKRLADNGLRYMFVGHSHIQRTDDYTSPSSNKLTEVNVGSLCGYPAPMVNVVVNDDNTLSYEVDHLKDFVLNGETIDAQEYLKKHLTDLVHNVINVESKTEFAERLTALQLNGEKLAKYYPIAKHFIKNIRYDNVNDFYKRLRRLGLSKLIKKEWLAELGEVKVMDFVDQVLMSAMDGSIKTFDRNSNYYKLVMAVVSVPSRLKKSNMDMKRLIMAVDTILAGGKYNNQSETI